MSPDLRTTYLGLELANPLVPSASPLGQRIETLRALQDAGAAAVVLPSLFEEQIEHDEIQFTGALEAGAESYAEALTYLPEFADYTTGTDAYLRHVEATVRDLEIPVIGSLNGISLGGWVEHARRIEDAGAARLGAERLLHRRRPRRERRSGRAALRGPCGSRASRAARSPSP